MSFFAPHFFCVVKSDQDLDEDEDQGEAVGLLEVVLGKLEQLFQFAIFLLLLLAACAGPAATPPPAETGPTEITVFRSPT